MKGVIRRFGNDEEGSTVIEYALIACIVSIAVVAGLTGTRTTLNSSLSEVGSQLESNAAN